MEGVILPNMDKIKECTNDRRKVVEINAKAMITLFYALSLEELN